MSSFSFDQVQQLRDWLPRHGFKPVRSSDSKSIEYRRPRDKFGVQVVDQSGHYSVQLWANKPSTGWEDLDELINRRSEWPQALTMSRMQLATLPEPSFPETFIDWRSFRRHPGETSYRIAKPWAHFLKVILQMAVGIGAVVYIGWYAYRYLNSHTMGSGPDLKAVSGAVNIIAFALVVAAGIELAYTLFTPGPDEALDPLMLGISSGILLLVTTPGLQPLLQFFGVLLGVLALGALFLIRRHLLDQDDG
jgi:hypothetical protein